eukprot:TRINITY_DN3885_c0_g1_i1.p1 TRINITY_DN3885_c0_g1~~TRINITY_DN3885_c0_g1_i1.p1  ORF type:complete len:208 (+),score=24.50 TRINITY_DN3885_c0_g1_i1:67-690(+)
MDALDGFEVEILNEENYHRLVDPYLPGMVTTENLCSHGGATLEMLTQFYENMKGVLCSGLTMVATKGGAPVCWRMSVDGYELDQLNPPVVPGLEFLDAVFDVVEKDVKKATRKGELCKYLGLHTHHDYLGKGLGTAITLKHIELLKKLGYSRVYVFATSEYSKRIFLKCGFRAEEVFLYKDWEWQGKKIYANVPPPHKGVTNLFLDL